MTAADRFNYALSDGLDAQKNESIFFRKIVCFVFIIVIIFFFIVANMLTDSQLFNFLVLMEYLLLSIFFIRQVIGEFFQIFL